MKPSTYSVPIGVSATGFSTTELLNITELFSKQNVFLASVIIMVATIQRADSGLL